MPTRDDDWHRLIEGDDPSDPVGAIIRRNAQSRHLFEGFLAMESLKEASNAIRLADGPTVRRALLAAVVSRVCTPLSP